MALDMYVRLFVAISRRLQHFNIPACQTQKTITMNSRFFKLTSMAAIAAISIVAPLTSFAQTPPYDAAATRAYEVFQSCILVFIVLAVLFAVIAIFKIKAENKIRQQLIDKGIPDDTLNQMMKNGNERIRQETFKWGIITGCTGVGLIVCNYFAFGVLTFAVLFISISIGLLIYYFLSEKQK
jgi:uncharacterized membrane protein YozB (DUF420 family)